MGRSRTRRRASRQGNDKAVRPYRNETRCHAHTPVRPEVDPSRLPQSEFESRGLQLNSLQVLLSSCRDHKFQVRREGTWSLSSCPNRPILPPDRIHGDKNGGTTWLQSKYGQQQSALEIDVHNASIRASYPFDESQVVRPKCIVQRQNDREAASPVHGREKCGVTSCAVRGRPPKVAFCGDKCLWCCDPGGNRRRAVRSARNTIH
jgi:hypothetical protein